MTDLFLSVLNASFSAVWVVLAVVLARLVLKKGPRWLVCALWGLVALRLIFGGVEAPFSLIPSSQLIPPESLFDQAPAIHSGVAVLDEAVNPIYSESLRPMPGASINPLQVWLAVFAHVWVVGMAVMALWAAFTCHRVRRQVRESIPDGGVYLCDRICSPFIFGLFRPRIYLPSGLDEDARDHVLAHERAHIARRDHWWKPLGFLILTVHWFNPALWLAYVLLCRDIELACDERVVKTLSAGDKKAYSSALLQCSLPRHAIAACPLAFGEVGVKARVKNVLNYKKPAFWVVLTAVVLSLVLAACLLTDPTSEPAEIRWNGALYIQEGDPVDTVPDKQENTGTLRSVLHDSTPHPTEDGQAVRLGWEYAGQPIVQVGNTLYLQQPGDQGWLPFRMLTGADWLESSISEEVWYHLTLRRDRITSNEELTGSAADALTELLRDLTQQEMTPGPGLDRQKYADMYNSLITVDPEQYGVWYELFRTNEHGWVCFIHDIESGNSDWYFDGSGLDSFLQPYGSELETADYNTLLTEDTTLSLDFLTLERDGIYLRAAIPIMEEGNSHIHWEWEPIEDALGFRCRPIGRTDWMEVRFYDHEDTIYYHPFQSEPISFANGTSGTRYDSDDPARWALITLDTTQGQLHITAPDNVFQKTDWSVEDFSTAHIIPATLSLTRNGTSLLGTAPDLSRTENFTWDDVTIQLDLPENWEAESFHGSGHYGFRFRDKDYKNGWITVKYWPDRVTLIDYAGIVEAQTFRSGATANVYYTDAEDAENGLWDMVWFVDDDACMSVERPENYLWDWDYYAQTMGIIGSIRVFDSGEARFLPAPAAQGLGITLYVRDLTGQQLLLYYSQTGGPEGLKEILTDPNWSLERWEDGQWVTIRPLDMSLTDYAFPVPMEGTTAWTMELFSIEAGRYRIGKTFNGYFHPDSGAPEGQPLVQTCYAEFEANPLGITLSLRNVTPSGAALVCTQDGSDWDSILTGAPWSLERLEEGQWVSVMPESTVWTTIAYSVPTGQTTSWNINWSTICGELEPGTYRIGKRFTGTPVPPPFLLEKRDQVEQLCWAEFTIE